MDNPELALDQASVHNCSVSELDLDLRVSLTNGYLVKKTLAILQVICTLLYVNAFRNLF